MNKLLLIDGSSMLTTSFWGTVPSIYYKSKELKQMEILSDLLKTSTGKYVNAVYPMLKTLLKILNAQNCTHVVVAWDITRDTFRRQIYKDYKGNRDESPYQLKEQFVTMQNILRKLKIPQAMNNNFEADDFLGSYAEKFKNKIPVSILTKDRDALQLADENTSIWIITSKSDELNKKYNTENKPLPDHVFEYTPLYIEKEFGLTPSQLIDLKAIIGDKGDNIPGIKGIGEKTGIPLIKYYNSIEELFDKTRGISEDKKKTDELKKFWKTDLGISKSPVKVLFENPLSQAECDKFRNLSKEDKFRYFYEKDISDIVGEDSAVMSKLLGTIKKDIPIDKQLNDLSYDISSHINELSNVLNEYEFKSLMFYTKVKTQKPQEPVQTTLF